MSWAEFKLRLFSYKRIQKNKVYELRELMWTTLIAPHYDPKKLPKSKEAFMPLNTKKNKVNLEAVKVLKEARERYIKQLQING